MKTIFKRVLISLPLFLVVSCDGGSSGESHGGIVVELAEVDLIRVSNGDKVDIIIDAPTIKPANGVFLETSFEDLSFNNPETIYPLISNGFSFGAHTNNTSGSDSSTAVFTLSNIANSGEKSINLIPSGNPALERPSSVSFAYLNRKIDVTHSDAITLKFAFNSTSNPRIASVHNCDSAMDVYVNGDNTGWKHQMSYCGNHKSEGNIWRTQSLVIDTSGYSEVEFGFEYYLQNNFVADTSVHYLIDDLRISTGPM